MRREEKKARRILLKRLYLVFDRLPINRSSEEKRLLGLALFLFGGVIIVLSPLIPYIIEHDGVVSAILLAIIFIYLITVAIAAYEAWWEVVEARRKASKEATEA